MCTDDNINDCYEKNGQVDPEIVAEHGDKDAHFSCLRVLVHQAAPPSRVVGRVSQSLGKYKPQSNEERQSIAENVRKPQEVDCQSGLSMDDEEIQVHSQANGPKN